MVVVSLGFKFQKGWWGVGKLGLWFFYLPPFPFCENGGLPLYDRSRNDGGGERQCILGCLNWAPRSRDPAWVEVVLLVVMVADELNLGGSDQVCIYNESRGICRLGWLGWMRALGMLGACKCDLGVGWKNHGKLATTLSDWSM